MIGPTIIPMRVLDEPADPTEVVAAAGLTPEVAEIFSEEPSSVLYS